MSLTPKELWRMEQALAELKTLGTCFAQEGGIVRSQGRQPRGLPIIARETEVFCGTLLQDGIEAAKFDDNDCSKLDLFSVDFGNDIRRYFAECGKIIRILSLNSIIESVQWSFDGALALSEKMKRLAEVIGRTVGTEKLEHSSEVTNPYRQSTEVPYVLEFQIGDCRFIERVDRIIEIVFLRSDQKESAEFNNKYFSDWLRLRGRNIPLLIPKEEFPGKSKSSQPGFLGIRLALGESSGAPSFLVAVDEIVDAYRLALGAPGEYESSGIDSRYIDTAWDGKAGQFLFLDWRAFVKEDQLREMSSQIADLAPSF
jgi:hypothetical protein